MRHRGTVSSLSSTAKRPWGTLFTEVRERTLKARILHPNCHWTVKENKGLQKAPNLEFSLKNH